MIRKILLAALFCAAIAALAGYPPQWLWMQRNYGSGECTLYRLATDSQGRILASGELEGEGIFGGQTLVSEGASDGLIAMLDHRGYWLWARTYGDAGQVVIYDIVLDAQDNIYVTGTFTQSCTLGGFSLINNGGSDIFLARLDPSGEVLDATSLGSAGADQPQGLAATSDGTVFLSGGYRNSITIGNTTLTNNFGLFISKWDHQLEPVWALQGTSPYPVECNGLGTDAAGNCYFIGNFRQSYSLGDPAPINLYSNQVSGCVIKLNQYGSGIWGERISDGGTGVMNSYVDHSGNTYVVCDQVGTYDAGDAGRLDVDPVWGKLNCYGIWDWYELENDEEICAFSKIHGDAEGNCYVTGELWSTCEFGDYTLWGSLYANNIFVAKGDPSGQWQWGLQTYDAGALYYLLTADIVSLDNGDCVIVGSNSTETLHFGDFPASPSPNRYTFLLRISGEVTSVEDELQPPAPQISVCPNPSRDGVEFRLGKYRGTIASVCVRNIRGQTVRHFNPSGLAGKSSLYWDGLDDSGDQTSPGIYYLRIDTGTKIVSKAFTRT